jgi:hypothetical protein
LVGRVAGGAAADAQAPPAEAVAEQISFRTVAKTSVRRYRANVRFGSSDTAKLRVATITGAGAARARQRRMSDIACDVIATTGRVTRVASAIPRSLRRRRAMGVAVLRPDAPAAAESS